MILSLLICDSTGYPFYSRTFNQNGGKKIDPMLLSGLISTIGTIGRRLFNEEIATISFGTGRELANIVIVTKELTGSDRIIYFVFISKGDINKKMLSQFCTNVFIETKSILRDPRPDTNLDEKINRIIDFKYKTLATA